jgi:hypothetical protein
VRTDNQLVSVVTSKFDIAAASSGCVSVTSAINLSKGACKGRGTAIKRRGGIAHLDVSQLDAVAVGARPLNTDGMRTIVVNAVSVVVSTTKIRSRAKNSKNHARAHDNYRSARIVGWVAIG